MRLLYTLVNWVAIKQESFDFAGLAKGVHMSDCLHCDIHEMLESHLQSPSANLAEIAAKVTEVLADLILMAPADEQSMLMADVMANLGNLLLEKNETTDPTQPRRSSH